MFVCFERWFFAIYESPAYGIEKILSFTIWTGREGLIDCFSIPAGDTSSYLPVNNGPLKTKAEIPSFNSRDPRSYLTPAHQVPSSAGLRRK